MANFGSLVSSFVHSFTPSEPIQPQGQAVSSFVHELHAIPPNPITPQGQVVSSFVHELHDPSPSLGPEHASPDWFLT